MSTSEPKAGVAVVEEGRQQGVVAPPVCLSVELPTWDVHKLNDDSFLVKPFPRMVETRLHWAHLVLGVDDNGKSVVAIQQEFPHESRRNAKSRHDELPKCPSGLLHSTKDTMCKMSSCRFSDDNERKTGELDFDPSKQLADPGA